MHAHTYTADERAHRACLLSSITWIYGTFGRVQRELPVRSLRSQRFGCLLHLFACRARHGCISIHQMLVQPTRCYVCRSPSSIRFRSPVPPIVIPRHTLCERRSRTSTIAPTPTPPATLNEYRVHRPNYCTDRWCA
ncbi:hypothetical protein BDN70DRAFT_626323 [Pholiota conissans]|uniref:Uncharacterized protein n=1 Tax=Pholiota conissans TaxID=109636 RepID=A0A9P5YJA2_9AGAR|nr:hypothetical protein BDN70DRAFT_626323 [Pholiota conissans]